MNARQRSAGFTLVEVVVAMVLIGSILILVYSGLSFSLRAWDAGDANGRRTAERRLGENFLRRELSELFPMRWKDPTQVRMAFEGGQSSLRFVSSRPAGLQLGGLSLVGIELADNRERRTRDLVMLRAMPDHEARDFGPLSASKPHLLIEGVDRVEFGYFGSENEFAEPKWYDAWDFPAKIPELVVRVALGEEAGCLENSFQRLCRPRRPS